MVMGGKAQWLPHKHKISPSFLLIIIPISDNV